MSRLVETLKRGQLINCDAHPKSPKPVVINRAKKALKNPNYDTHYITKITANSADNNGPTTTQRRLGNDRIFPETIKCQERSQHKQEHTCRECFDVVFKTKRPLHFFSSPFSLQSLLC